MIDAETFLALTDPRGFPLYVRKEDVRAISVSQEAREQTLVSVYGVGVFPVKESPAAVFEALTTPCLLN